MITAGKLSSDRYMLKIALVQSGTSPDDLTIPNATLVGLMDEGPLKDLWSAYYADSAAALAALQDGPLADVIMQSQAVSATGAPAWSVVVSASANKGVVTFHGDPAGDPYLVEFTYRHSTGR